MITFDLQHYQFLGSCSYLLAKDFEGGDFEVFGEYESESGATRLKSVVVHGPNVDVTLSPDGSVTSRRLSSAEVCFMLIQITRLLAFTLVSYFSPIFIFLFLFSYICVPFSFLFQCPSQQSMNSFSDTVIHCPSLNPYSTDQLFLIFFSH